MTNKDEKLGKLEGWAEGIDKRMDNIENNHLPHIYNRLGKIEKKLAYYAGAILIIGIIAQIIIKDYYK